MDKNITSIDIPSGGVLQCQPSKASNEAQLDMNNNSITINIPKWNYTTYDLETVPEISKLLSEQSIKGYSVSTLYEGYSVLCLMDEITTSRTNQNSFNISLSELSKIIHFGDTDKTAIKSTKKVLDVLARLSINGSFLFSLNETVSDIKKIQLDKKFRLNIKGIVQKHAHHDCLQINQTIYHDFLKKIKRQQHAYAVFLEKLYQESKRVLEQDLSIPPYDRTRLSLKRLSQTFNPADGHSANEIYRNGEKLLIKIFGSDIDDRINDLAQKLVTNKHKAKFEEKVTSKEEKSSLEFPELTLFDIRNVANDKNYCGNSQIKGRHIND